MKWSNDFFFLLQYIRLKGNIEQVEARFCPIQCEYIELYHLLHFPFLQPAFVQPPFLPHPRVYKQVVYTHLFTTLPFTTPITKNAPIHTTPI